MGQNLCYCYTNNSKISDDININTPNQKQKQKQNTNKKQNNFTIQKAEIKISNDDESKLKNGQKESDNKMASEDNNKSLNIPAQVGISNDKFKIGEIVGSGNTEINVFNSKENINTFKPSNSLKNSSTKIN